jgi:outer membrane lipoprotein carrier protein
MKSRLMITFLCLVVWAGFSVFGGTPSVHAADTPNMSASLEDIMAGVEKRYGGMGFSARFEQTSTIKAMEITDTASGEVIIKRPGKMRWIYEKPDRQVIVTDGVTLWVHKPDDNQVMVGGYPTFFGDGKGASFLSDMKLVREQFQISLEQMDDKGDPILRLLPDKKKFDISHILLLVSAKTFNILQISTYNFDGDETRIELKDTDFKSELDEALFHFEIPDGIDVLKLED